VLLSRGGGLPSCHAAFCNRARSASLRPVTSASTPMGLSSNETARKSQAGHVLGFAGRDAPTHGLEGEVYPALVSDTVVDLDAVGMPQRSEDLAFPPNASLGVRPGKDVVAREPFRVVLIPRRCRDAHGRFVLCVPNGRVQRRACTRGRQPSTEIDACPLGPLWQAVRAPVRPEVAVCEGLLSNPGPCPRRSPTSPCAEVTRRMEAGGKAQDEPQPSRRIGPGEDGTGRCP
jgi:hypothetical protein